MKMLEIKAKIPPASGPTEILRIFDETECGTKWMDDYMKLCEDVASFVQEPTPMLLPTFNKYIYGHIDFENIGDIAEC